MMTGRWRGARYAVIGGRWVVVCRKLREVLRGLLAIRASVQ